MQAGLIEAIDDDAVARYRSNYNLGPEIGREHVVRHVELEGALTRQLLESSPENRWSVFENAYDTLYKELGWLNQAEDPVDDEIRFAAWRKLLPKPSRVFEIGSGKAELLKYLSRLGHTCVATEITRERGAVHAQDAEGLQWRTTDGVHLDRFEPPGAYDVVLSTQVVEHLHPDDLVTHFASARTLLAPGGVYIFDTPHRGSGPHDLSRPLGLDRAAFMHLKEYDYAELSARLRQAGYSSLQAVVSMRGRSFRSALALWVFTVIDSVMGALRLPHRLERRIRQSPPFRLLGPRSNIWIVAAP